MANKTITDELLLNCRQKVLNDPTSALSIRAVTQVGPIEGGMNRDIPGKLPYVFSVDLKEQGLYDQGTSGRCWAISSMNALRYNIAKKLDMEDQGFRLSGNYIYFYDQLEKCANNLAEVLEKIDKPLDDPGVQRVLRMPIADNGQWYIFASLANRYGVVPQSVMPDTQCTAETRYVSRVLGDKLRYSVKRMRESYAQDKDTDKVKAVMEEEIADIYAILCRFLGVPPQSFNFEYRDRKGNWHCHQNMTPVEFFKKFGYGMDEYMFIIHHPSEKRPFMQTYYMDSMFKEAPARPEPAILLNADMPLIKQAVISQLRHGEQVVMGCDVGQQSNKAQGFMDPQLYPYEELFGARLNMTKAERILYKATRGTHIMSFSGVNLLPDGTPDRWKVQNSYGSGTGVEGHYIMSDRWFDEYVLSVVIRKEYAPKELVEAYEKQPLPMSMSEWY